MPLTPSAYAVLHESRWQKFVKLLLHRRVRITGIIFFALIAEDMWTRVDPHDLTNLRDLHSLAGLGLVFAGLGLRSWAAGTLHKRTRLAMTGPYQLFRHPLYIGSMFMMLGFCTLVGDQENIWFVLGPILFIYVLRALHEEKSLAAAFPNKWPEYARKVPRFIPRRFPTQPFTDWRLAQWMKNREYQAFGAALLGLAAVKVWQVII